MNTRRGFTLAELMVVVLIFAILSVMGVLAYQRTVETAKADIARGLVVAIAKANRTYAVDHNFVRLNGGLNLCAATTALDQCFEDGNPCRLIGCRYLSQQNFDETRYDFFAVNGPLPPRCAALGAGGSNYSACARRRPGAPPPYNNWGYTVTQDGVLEAWPASGGPPGAGP